MNVVFFVLLKFFSDFFYEVNCELSIFTHSLIQFLIDFVDFVEIILVFLFLINIFSHAIFLLIVFLIRSTCSSFLLQRQQNLYRHLPLLLLDASSTSQYLEPHRVLSRA